MKYLRKILVIIAAILTVVLSVRSSHAEDEWYTMMNVTPKSSNEVQISFDKDIKLEWNDRTSDLRIYQDIEIEDAVRVDWEAKKVLVKLATPIQKSSSYSILSISWIEWSMELDIKDTITGVELKNDDTDENFQWINKIIITDSQNLEIYFIDDILEDDLEFKFYRNVPIKKVVLSWDAKKVDFILWNNLEDTSKYVATLTLIEWEDWSKITIEWGIYDFSTEILEWWIMEDVEDIKESSEEKNESSATKAVKSVIKSLSEEEKSLEEELLESMKDSDILNKFSSNASELLDEEKELANELLSASEDIANNIPTQLESIALGTDETPDTGAETWVLIMLTFIINTYYTIARRKKEKLA